MLTMAWLRRVSCAGRETSRCFREEEEEEERTKWKMSASRSYQARETVSRERAASRSRDLIDLSTSVPLLLLNP